MNLFQLILYQAFGYRCNCTREVRKA
jgi:hypothetical protein